jgi:hypothetical protein
MEPPHLLTEELKEFGINERNNIAKEKTKNKNQLYVYFTFFLEVYYKY